MAREFDAASSQYLTNANAIVSNEPYTIAAWCYSLPLSDYAHSPVLTIDNGNWDVLAYFNVFKTPTDYMLRLSKYYIVEGIAVVAIPSISTWNHYVGIGEADDDRRVYVNGSATSGSNSTSIGDGSYSKTDIARVANSVSGAHYQEGYLAEVALWSAALSTAEIDILAEGYSPLFVRPQNLVSYWPLIRDEDQDRVGGYHMTANGSPTVAAHPPKVRSWWFLPTLIGAPAEAPADLSIAIMATNPDCLVKGVKVVG